MTRITLLALAVPLALAACAKPSSSGTSGSPEDKATIETLEKRLKKTERKLARIERFLLQNGASLDPEPEPDAVYAVPLNAQDPILGPATAKITIVEAFEFA